MAAVTAEPLKIGHQHRVRCPELRRFVDGEPAALALEANHALVDNDSGHVPLASDESPHGELPEIRNLRVLRDEVPASSHLHLCCDACQVREGH